MKAEIGFGYLRDANGKPAVIETRRIVRDDSVTYSFEANWTQARSNFESRPLWHGAAFNGL